MIIYRFIIAKHLKILSGVRQDKNTKEGKLCLKLCQLIS